jgi:tetratricopeptide (TPR) repeat protein
VLAPPRIATFFKGVLLAWVLLAETSARAQAPKDDGPETARSLYDKATGAYALGNYKRAAELYERAFELKPDPALLFNGAQAHRLAGNKERAYELYRSYLRVYPKGPGRVEAARHAENLKRELEEKSGKSGKNEQNAAANQPPAVAPPSPAMAPLSPPAVSPSFTQPSPTDAELASKAPEPGERSLFRRPIFWVIAGTVVLVALGAGIAVAASGSKDPAPATWGTIGPGMGASP